jgi:type I restriction enzyme R subunit
MDEDVVYSGKQLNDSVVNPNQIRLIIQTFKAHLPEMFPDRKDEKGVFEVPKTLIFAETDSHADDIIQIVREEFGEESRFCKKITYGTEDPKSTLAQFRNDYLPRIAVTVDMIATGTDVKPLECLLFLRDVRSRNYFEQMKGRGTRTIDLDALKKVTPTAKFTKDHFVIVDAVGVTKSLKTDSRPLEKKPGVPLKDLLDAVAVGARDEALFTSLAGRLARLEKRLTEKEKAGFQVRTNGKTIPTVVKELLNAHNPDTLEALRENVERRYAGEAPVFIEAQYNEAARKLQDNAAAIFTGDLNTYIETVRKVHTQLIDTINPDTLRSAGWDAANTEKAQTLISGFTEWMDSHKDEITALQIFYGQPYRRRELTYRMISELYDLLKTEKPALAPLSVWRAYEQLGATTGKTPNGSPKNELMALVSLIRAVSGIDTTLTAFDKTVDRNFQEWVFMKQAGTRKFTEEQMQWLRLIKDYVAGSFHIDRDDFDLSPFNQMGGLSKFYELFKSDYEVILNELNEALAA